MTTLHLIRSSAFSDNQLALCLKNLLASDSIILLDDGCYNVAHPLLSQAATIISPEKIFALQSHVKARNIRLSNTDNIALITMAELLSHSCTYTNVITWQ